MPKCSAIPATSTRAWHQLFSKVRGRLSWSHIPASLQRGGAREGLRQPVLSKGAKLTARVAATGALLLGSFGLTAVFDDDLAVASSPSKFTFAVSTAAGGATYVRLALGFTSSGVLTDGSATITVNAPSGTVFDDSNTSFDFVVDDTTTGQTWAASSASITDGGSEATLTINASTTEATINAGDSVTLTINDVTNPAASTAFSGVSLSTSSDTTPASFSGGGSFTSANAVQNLSFSTNTSAGGATYAQWVLKFTASSSGPWLAGSTPTTTGR